MYKECAKLSPLFTSEYLVDTKEYIDALYRVFSINYKNNTIQYEGLPVRLRVDPLYEGKEETFWHFISDTHLNGRWGQYIIDTDRSRRIMWPHDLVLNSPCATLPHKPNCKGIYIWDIDHNKTFRRKILHTHFSYMTIIEKRENYWLWITSYRLTKRTKDEQIREYTKSRKKQKTSCL